MSAAVLAQAGANDDVKANVAMEFDTQLLANGSAASVDVTRFAHGNPVIQGTYRSDVYLNGHWLGRLDVSITVETRDTAAPCLDRVIVTRLGVDPSKLLPEALSLLGGKTEPATDSASARGATTSRCLHVSQIVEGGVAVFDPSEQRLDITIPQANMLRRARGYVPPEMWDSGINAASLAYQFNSVHNDSLGLESSSQYLGLNLGANLGDWNFHHQGSLTSSSAQGRQYQQIATYARRDLTDWRSSLTLGDSYSDGQLYDSFGFRGLVVASDDRMVPDSQRGFAPTIRGQARSNAKVEVRQGSVLIYETLVPPGPFEIGDLYPTGFGGDLLVTVTEADGSQTSFKVAYSASPMLLREGGVRYSVLAGQMLGTLKAHDVAQGAVQYGLNNVFTLEAASQMADRYRSILLGSAVNTGLGALSLNYSESNLDDPARGSLTGASVQLSWAKLLQATSTNFSLAAYRYSTQNYFSLQDAMTELDGQTTTGVALPRIRSRLVFSFNQTLGKFGSLSASATSQTYWTQGGRDSTYQLNYAIPIGRAQLSLGLNRQFSTIAFGPVDAVTLSLSMPLGDVGGQAVNLSSSVSHDAATGTTGQASVSGSLGEDSQFNYSASTVDSRSSNSATGTASYRTPIALVGAGLTKGTGVSQATLSASGGIVIHGGGVTLAPVMGDTMGLVKVEGAPGAQILGTQGVKVDGHGYAVVPYLSPYALNSVELDLAKVPLGVQMENVSQNIVPRAGAIVEVDFKRQAGQLILIRAKLEDGSALPFGANVFDDKGDAIGVAGQAGLIEAHVATHTGRLVAKWGASSEQSCRMDYTLPSQIETASGLVHMQAVCKSAGAPFSKPLLTAMQTPDQTDPAQATPKRLALLPAIITVTLSDGSPLPRGANVTSDDGGGVTGVAADNGRVFMHLSSSANVLTASWTLEGDGSERSCSWMVNESVDSRLPAGSNNGRAMSCNGIVSWVRKNSVAQSQTQRAPGS